jgi:hypothetical protein
MYNTRYLNNKKDVEYSKCYSLAKKKILYIDFEEILRNRGLV